MFKLEAIADTNEYIFMDEVGFNLEAKRSYIASSAQQHC